MHPWLVQWSDLTAPKTHLQPSLNKEPRKEVWSLLCAPRWRAVNPSQGMVQGKDPAMTPGVYRNRERAGGKDPAGEENGTFLGLLGSPPGFKEQRFEEQMKAWRLLKLNPPALWVGFPSFFLTGALDPVIPIVVPLHCWQQCLREH